MQGKQLGVEERTRKSFAAEVMILELSDKSGFSLAKEEKVALNMTELVNHRSRNTAIRTWM